MNEANTVFIQYGALGAFVVVLIWAYIRLEKRTDARFEKMEERHTKEIETVEARHKTERNDWLNAMKSIWEEQKVLQKDTNATIKNTGDIITGVKTLFEVHAKNSNTKA